MKVLNRKPSTVSYQLDVSSHCSPVLPSEIMIKREDKIFQKVTLLI